jgi:urease accessory protein
MADLLAALLLADGRFPSGAHAHSLGLEAAVTAGLVTGMDDLGSWVAGNLGTTWRVDAAVAVLASRLVHSGAGPDDWSRLDAEVTARTTSPQLREVSRRLGRQLLRAVARTWPAATLAAMADTHPDGPHVAVVQGAAAAVAGVADADVAVVTLHGAVQLATSAAVRLLGLDPYAVVRSVADLAPHLAAVAAEVTAATGDDPAALPGAGAPMLDLLLAHHATADGRLFAS